MLCPRVLPPYCCSCCLLLTHAPVSTSLLLTGRAIAAPTATLATCSACLREYTRSFSSYGLARTAWSITVKIDHHTCARACVCVWGWGCSGRPSTHVCFKPCRNQQTRCNTVRHSSTSHTLHPCTGPMRLLNAPGTVGWHPFSPFLLYTHAVCVISMHALSRTQPPLFCTSSPSQLPCGSWPGYLSHLYLHSLTPTLLYL